MDKLFYIGFYKFENRLDRIELWFLIKIECPS